jgi:hypothetical protein
MKTLLTLYFLIGLIPLRAEEAPPIITISDALRIGKMAKLELDKATFEQALALVRAEWKRQYPTLDFPVSLAEYDRDHGYPPLITMSLHDVPFIKALQYIGETSRRRLVKKPDLLTFEEVGLIVEDWITKSHPVSEELEDWMTIGYHDGVLVVLAYEPQQEQIAGINFLLSQGYKITKGEQGGAGQPATRSQSKSEGSQNPQHEAEGRSR